MRVKAGLGHLQYIKYNRTEHGLIVRQESFFVGAETRNGGAA